MKVLSDREHILKRPSMYIGGINDIEKEFFIFNGEYFESKKLRYNPGLIKIFYEILDNSIDSFERNKFQRNKLQKNKIKNFILKVDINNDNFKVQDNGEGIPIKKNEDEIYFPRLAWGFARAGSNFDDDERVTIGMNGVGSFLTNVYSKKFIGISKNNGKRYEIIFENNAETFKENLSLSNVTGVEVEVYPDFEKFKRKEFSESEIEIIKSRLFYLSYLYDFKIVFNNEEIKLKEIKLKG